jgi:hypothetical protein
VKCPQCGYENKPEADSCNLCRAVLRKIKKGTMELKVPLVERHRLEAVGSPPIELTPNVEFTIGRQPGSGLTIPSTRVSRLHAIIRWENDKPILVDKGSSNGTFVKGKRIKEHALQEGDELEVGPFLCVYRFGETPATRVPRPDETGEMTQTIASQGDVFTGMISEGGLAEVLSGLEFNKKTGTLDVFGKEGDGWLAIENGLPLAASANGLEGNEAIISLLMMKSGRYSFSAELQVKERVIKATITALLLEWGRRADEQQQQQGLGEGATELFQTDSDS